MRRVLSATLGVALLVGLAAAQSPGDKRPSVALAPIGTVQVHPGATADVEMAFRVGDGFHINSNQPHSDFLIPTQLKLTATEPVAIAGVKYPAGKDETFPFSPNDKLNVYSGDFSIDAIIKAPAKAAAGTYPVKGELSDSGRDKAAC